MKTNPSPSSLDLTTPAAALAYLKTIDSPTVEIAGAGDQLSPVDDAIRAITGESSNSFALSQNCWLWSTPELVRVLAEYVGSPSWLPAPAGVSGQSSVKDAAPAVPVQSSGVSASPVKDMPAGQQTYFQSAVVAMVGDRIATGSMGDCKVLELTSDGYLRVENIFTKETAHVFASDCDLVDRPVPASPVDSVGVPAFRVLEGLTRRMQPDAFAHAEELYGIIMSEGTGFAIDVYAAKGMPMEQFKATLSAFAGNAASHAANLAKIKALEESVKDLSQIISHIMHGGDAYLKDAKYREAIGYGLDAARAALALPSA